jgi:ubiquinone/menaquinone biosynthesis C-methylase UbiE/DNA-binding transcriptional ArsR family regulator
VQPSPLKLLALLADPTRLRILSILENQELSVAEVQDCLRVGQSRISTHLAQLRAAGVLEDRREGQRVYYRRREDLGPETLQLLALGQKAASELPEHADDQAAQTVVLQRRKEQTQQYFNTLAGRLGKNYCPGRSWQAIGHLLIQLTPPIVIADLGAGEGLLSQLLAAKAKKIIAVDNSPKMVEVGTELAQKNGLTNLEYRLGDMEEPPIDAASVDLVILSQALHHAAQPERALKACHRILKKGGQLLILDLNEHHFEKARELYADVWLGFSEAHLQRMLRDTKFRDITTSIVAKETEPPHFQTILASAVK